MRHLMHLLKLPDADVGVDLGRGQVRMPQQLLDVPNIRSILQHEGGASVSQ